MLKKILITSVLTASACAVINANAALPMGLYVSGQAGYADTHIKSQVKNNGANFANNGLTGRLAMGYKITPNFALEVGYLQLPSAEFNIDSVTFSNKQHAIDVAAKGQLSVTNNVGIYGKLGLAYLTTQLEAKNDIISKDINSRQGIDKHQWSPEIAVGMNYNITPNVTVDTSLTHIQTLGNDRPAAMTANAAAPGVYVTGQVGYANTHMGSKTKISDILGPFAENVDSAAINKNLSNNGLAGRIALGYQFSQNFALEAGYLQLGEGKVNLGAVHDPHSPAVGEASLKLQQNAIDLVGKGILPLASNFNLYGKLGVAYVTSDVKGTLQVPGLPTLNADLNNRANVAKHKWAPEAAIGVSYDITPNVSVDTSWTHIQPLGNNKPGNIDFVAVGLGYNFG
ncbi:hypothetical protein FQR65_LT05112 [Abscondita terminalis]|nr:hypothetical protein FQR65_LT05112 [Abscondita terminalis]